MAVDGDTLVVGAREEDGGPGDPLSDAGAAYVFERGPAGAWTQTAKLQASDLQVEDRFGFSMAMDGDTLVVGALFEDGGPGDPLSDAGAAYVFERGPAGAWTQTAKLQADDHQADDSFGWSVALHGDTLVVGAWLEDGGPGDPLSGAGAAYVFERGPAGAWSEVAKLSASDAQESDQFGYSVAVDGDTLVVGAEGENGGPGDPLSGAGAAYVFERGPAGAWTQTAKLQASDLQAEDRFGYRVAMDGDTLVVGAFEEDGGPGNPAPNAGAAYVFDRGPAGAWTQTAKLQADDHQAEDRFGWSVALHGDTLVVGAGHEDGGPGDPVLNAGAAYVFARGSTGAWTQAAKLLASDLQAYDIFGFSMAVSNDTLVVGAPYEDGGPGDPTPNSGSAYIFDLSPEPDTDTDGWTATCGDCDDSDPNAYPGNTEVCDSIDNTATR